ncbi:MAG: hypothetical protein AAF911_15265 [Planctomycetota bacterium]
MKTAWTTLLLGEDTWNLGLADANGVRVVELSAFPKQASIQTKVDAAIAKARQAAARLGPLVLGLPSTWCMSATVSTDGLQRRQRRQGLIYRLEERLPINAEDFTADFLPPAPGSDPGSYATEATTAVNVMGIAILHEWVNSIIDALGSAGLTVAHVIPTACLAHTKHKEQELSDRPYQLTALGTSSSCCDFILAIKGTPIRWHVTPSDPQALAAARHTLAGHLKPEDLTVSVVGMGPAGRSALTVNGLPNSLSHDKLDIRHLAVAQATDLVKHGQTPEIDLRRDALAGHGTWTRVAKPAVAAMAAAALLLVSFGVLNVWQANRIQTLAAQHEQARTALFRDTFPGQRVPVAVVSRFRSEAAKARGLTGEDEALPATATTLADLRDLLAGLPKFVPTPRSDTDASEAGGTSGGMRFQIDELRLEFERFYLDGRVRSHADADRLVAGLRSTLDYTLDAPRTQNLNSSALGSSHRSATNRNTAGVAGDPVVSVTITGQRTEAKP